MVKYAYDWKLIWLNIKKKHEAKNVSILLCKAQNIIRTSLFSRSLIPESWNEVVSMPRHCTQQNTGSSPPSDINYSNIYQHAKSSRALLPDL